ncbi:MAG: M20/M25/M40 family metallo-hydrolase, partial [Spirochaetia bacterium]|nr:M20/M25/M40 family metallo-hydrolase [Spirochaetia bacterium]
MSGRSAGATVLKILGGSLVVLVVYVSLSFEQPPAFASVGSIPRQYQDIDWSAVSASAAKDLQELIRIRTVRGNEREAAQYIQEKLRGKGIDSTIIEYPGKPDRVSLLAELPAEKADAGIILGNHLDVVEADAAEWKVPPFEGKREGNRIYGRGALDMKGMAVMQLHAFLLLKEKKVPLARKVMFLSIADEESGSKLGADYLVSQKSHLFRPYKTMLNEGGLGTRGV